MGVKTITTKTTVKVKTWGFRVERRFFYFRYKLWVNGKLKVRDEEVCEGHSRSPKTMRNYLRNGYGNEIILKREVENMELK